MELIIFLTSGLFFGLLHAFEADHVAAVFTFGSQQKNIIESGRIGAVWGIGHTASLFFVAFLVLVLNMQFLQDFSKYFEYVVGAMLVLLGGQVLYKVKQDKWHIHKHEHGGVEHTHLHAHKQDSKHSHTHKSFFVGLIHGLAGSGALLILIATKAGSVGLGLSLVLLFGIGSIIGMMVVSALLRLPFLATKNLPKWQNKLQIVSGIVSIFVGTLILI